MDEGHIVVDSVASIEMADITDHLARESGFDSADDLIGIASHGGGKNVYLIRFRYLAPGTWDVAPARSAAGGERAAAEDRPTLLRRIRSSTAPTARRRRKDAPTGRRKR
jgi:hypothetical protein